MSPQQAARGTTQGWLDFCLSLPVGASRALLEAALTGYSPWLSPKTRKVRLANMTTFTDPAVRANIATIMAWAGKHASPGSDRYAQAAYRAAVVIKRGEALR